MSEQATAGALTPREVAATLGVPLAHVAANLGRLPTVTQRGLPRIQIADLGTWRGALVVEGE